MTDTTDQQAVTVAQEDREAASQFAQAVAELDNPTRFGALAAQAFARHRQESADRLIVGSATTPAEIDDFFASVSSASADTADWIPSNYSDTPEPVPATNQAGEVERVVASLTETQREAVLAAKLYVSGGWRLHWRYAGETMQVLTTLGVLDAGSSYLNTFALPSAITSPPSLPSPQRRRRGRNRQLRVSLTHGAVTAIGAWKRGMMARSAFAVAVLTFPPLAWSASEMANPPPRLPDRKYLDAAALEMGHADWFKVPCAFMTDENVAIITRAWELNVNAVAVTPTPPTLSEDLREIQRTLAAGRIIDIMTGGKFDWRQRLDRSDFLESADWLTALAYADAALAQVKAS